MGLGKVWKIAGMMAAAMAVLSVGHAVAEDFPTRQITMYVPFVAGGNSDFAARALQPGMAKALGQAVVVVNKAGASGALGAVTVLTAKPDGYTIGLIPVNPLVVQPQTQKLPYDLDSFKYICHVYYSPYVLMVAPDSPLKTFKDFVAAARARPNAITYGTVGPSSDPHLTSLELFKAIGAQGLHVPFNGGGALAPALLAHTVSVVIEAPSLALSNGLHVLAIFADARIPTMPDVPTVKEEGYDVSGFTPNAGLIAPGKTPDDVVAKLQDACEKGAASEDYQTITKRLGITGTGTPGATYRQILDTEMKKVTPVLIAGGLKKS